MDNRPTEQLVEYIQTLDWGDLPSQVIETTRVLVLDYFASAMAGYRINKFFNETLTRTYLAMGGKKESRVFFHRDKAPAPHAALLNAAYGHGADMDDGHRAAQGHPGVAIIPAVLALAEACKLNGRELILAVVAGYDVFIRLAACINPSHFGRGFHTTGTVGTIAAGAAVAKALGLDHKGVQSALSLAALQAAGLLEVVESGQMVKPLHPAKAAYNGIIAGLLAREGAEGPRDFLEGSKGFLKAFADKTDIAILHKDLGKKFEISSCYMKLYPSCRHTHAAIDAAIELHRTMKPFTPKVVEKIKVYIYPAAIKLTGSIFEPLSEDEAKFSLPYTVATALYSGNFSLNDLNVAASLNRDIRELVFKVEIISEPGMENRSGNVRGCRVELLMKDGVSKTVTVTLPKGDPEVSVSRSDLENKVRVCAEGILPEKRQDKLINVMQDFENLTSIEKVTRLLVL